MLRVVPPTSIPSLSAIWLSYVTVRLIVSPLESPVSLSREYFRLSTNGLYLTSASPVSVPSASAVYMPTSSSESEALPLLSNPVVVTRTYLESLNSCFCVILTLTMISIASITSGIAALIIIFLNFDLFIPNILSHPAVKNKITKGIVSLFLTHFFQAC